MALKHWRNILIFLCQLNQIVMEIFTLAPMKNQFKIILILKIVYNLTQIFTDTV